MKSYLLPHFYKNIGWVLFIPSLIVGLIYMLVSELPYNPKMISFGLFGSDMMFSKQKMPFRFDEIELIPNLTSILLLIGGLLVMFSKQKIEDEYINQIRLNSLQNAVLINYILLFLSILLIHGIPFFHVMIYNLFTIILIYIIRFHFLIYKNSNNNNE